MTSQDKNTYSEFERPQGEGIAFGLPEEVSPMAIDEEALLSTYRDPWDSPVNLKTNGVH